MRVNPYTFGNSVASVQLAFALERADKNTARKISTHLCEFNKGLMALSSITDRKAKACMAGLWLNNFVNHNLKIANLPDFNFDTTMKNVIHYRYRLWLEAEKLGNKQLQRDRMVKNAREAAKAKVWIKKNIP